MYRLDVAEYVQTCAGQSASFTIARRLRNPLYTGNVRALGRHSPCLAISAFCGGQRRGHENEARSSAQTRLSLLCIILVACMHLAVAPASKHAQSRRLTQQPPAFPSSRPAKQVVGNIPADNLSNGATVSFASNNAQTGQPNLRLLMSSTSAAGIMSLALPTQGAAGRKCVLQTHSCTYALRWSAPAALKILNSTLALFVRGQGRLISNHSH